ncbi:hypothetical protein PENTCL1PPCAC_9639, partial [Pristionchus entomophagus]
PGHFVSIGRLLVVGHPNSSVVDENVYGRLQLTHLGSALPDAILASKITVDVDQASSVATTLHQLCLCISCALLAATQHTYLGSSKVEFLHSLQSNSRVSTRYHSHFASCRDMLGELTALEIVPHKVEPNSPYGNRQICAIAIE